MAVTLPVEAGSPVTLEEYVDVVQREVDPQDLDSICASAPVFARLLRNKSLMVDALNGELRRWRERERPNYYTGQSFKLIEVDWCTVRLNIWRPLTVARNVDEFDRDLSTYGVPHDHNFLFMTGGYFGPGYSTAIYEYDNTGFAGVPGEPVDITFLEHTQLEAGKVMLYRPHRDIHLQIAPSDFSVSLNLVVRRVSDLTKQQTTFDVKAGQVVCATDNPVEPQYLLCTIARHVANGDTASLLDDLATGHRDPMVRTICLDSLATVQPDAAGTVLEGALDDRDPGVKAFAARALEALGRGETGSFLEERAIKDVGFHRLPR